MILIEKELSDKKSFDEKNKINEEQNILKGELFKKKSSLKESIQIRNENEIMELYEEFNDRKSNENVKIDEKNCC